MNLHRNYINKNLCITFQIVNEFVSFNISSTLACPVLFLRLACFFFIREECFLINLYFYLAAADFRKNFC